MTELADRLIRKADDYRALGEEHPESKVTYTVVELVLREIADAIESDEELEAA